NESDADSNISAIFTDSGSKSKSNSESKLDSEDSDNKTEAEGLDISRLRQKRYSDETASGLAKETIVKIIALIAEQKGLELTRRPKKNIYIKDVAEFARLVAITASRLSALLGLRYRDLILTLIRNPEGGPLRLFIFLTPEFTKRFLRKKAPNEFKIPEIIFDLTLALSPYIYLLGCSSILEALRQGPRPD
ncbi:hypothetical protein N7467_011933, partial [Penicillium canescens]